jgi:hypothetical protein
MRQKTKGLHYGIASVVIILVVIAAAVIVYRSSGPGPAIFGVSASISPTSQSGANGATLIYTVTINNTGNVSDNYSLTVSDTAGWFPSVSPNSLTVPAGSNGTSTLTVTVPSLIVTVPSNVVVGTIDNIKVTANGTGVSSSASCTAQVSGPPTTYRTQ